MKVLSPTSGFPNWGSGNGRRNSQRIRIWRLAGFDCRTLTGLGETETPLLEGTHKVVCTSGPRDKEQWPHRRLNQTHLLVLEGLLQRWGGWLWLTEGTRTLTAEVLGSTPWREPPWSPPLPHQRACRCQCWVASGQTTNREGTQPQPSADKRIKVLLSSAHQSNTWLYPPPVPPIRKLAQAS